MNNLKYLCLSVLTVDIDSISNNNSANFFIMTYIDFWFMSIIEVLYFSKARIRNCTIFNPEC